MPIWFAKRGSRPPRRRAAAGLQGGWIQRLRLWSGLALMTYAATHLANHSVGLSSLADAEAVRLYLSGFWRSIPGTVLLAGAITLHVVLVVAKLLSGKTWRLPPWQWAQIVLGFAIPFVLAEHLFGTRMAHEVYGMETPYAFVLHASWPALNWPMVWLIGAVWLHGCLGIHYWARLYRGYGRLKPWLFAVALLLPVLAYAGYASAGREVAALRAADPFWASGMLQQIGFPGPEAVAFVAAGERTATLAAAAVILLVIVVRLARTANGRRGQITLTYPGGTAVRVSTGATLLEASRQNGIPHAAVCGGRGRCSTCRVRIGAGGASIPPPSEAEQRVLRRIGAPPDVRLACQVAVTVPLEVTPLLPPSSSPSAMAADGGNRYGNERDLAVLFCDIRGFTTFSEHKLPYDVVFVLNQYFRAMSEQIQANGGYVDKFIGDGLMALFGLEADRATACRQAVAAIRAMSAELEKLNRHLANELQEPLRIGIGVHTGQAIVGEIGYGRAAAITAIGDMVNVASRLEMMTKEHRVQAVISQEVADAAGIDASHLEHADLPIRGRTQPLSAVLCPSGSDLPAPAERG